MIFVESPNSRSSSSFVMDARIVGWSISARLYGNQPLSEITFLLDFIQENDFGQVELTILIISYGSIVR